MVVAIEGLFKVVVAIKRTFKKVVVTIVVTIKGNY